MSPCDSPKTRSSKVRRNSDRGNVSKNQRSWPENRRGIHSIRSFVLFLLSEKLSGLATLRPISGQPRADLGSPRQVDLLKPASCRFLRLARNLQTNYNVSRYSLPSVDRGAQSGFARSRQVKT